MGMNVQQVRRRIVQLGIPIAKKHQHPAKQGRLAPLRIHLRGPILVAMKLRVDGSSQSGCSRAPLSRHIRCKCSNYAVVSSSEAWISSRSMVSLRTLMDPVAKQGPLLIYVCVQQVPDLSRCMGDPYKLWLKPSGSAARKTSCLLPSTLADSTCRP